MKTKFISVLAVVAAITISNLQKANAQNWLLGGNNVGKDTTLGIKTNHSLKIITNSVERMRIDNAGNVGIGNSTPGFPLNFSKTTGDKISLYGNSGGHYGFGIKDFLLQIHTNASNSDIAFGYGSSSAFTETMRIKGNGSVGIGTLAPAARFEVKSAGNGPLAKFTNAAITGDRSALIDIQNGNGAFWRYGVGGTGNFWGLTNGEFYIERSGAGPVFTITKETNVVIKNALGINNAPPTAMLTIGDPKGAKGIYLSKSLGNDYTVEFLNTSTTNTFSTLLVTNNGTNQTAAIQGISQHGYGIEGISTDGWGVHGVSGTGYWAGYFDGNVYATGAFIPSDQNLKKDVQNFTSALSIIEKLNPKQYEYRKDAKFKFMSLPEGSHYGLIAQDVENILPNLVHETKVQASSGRPDSTKEDARNSETIKIKSLNYIEFIPILIKGMQEQQQQIDELKQMVNQLSQSKALTEDNASLKTINTVTNSTLGQNIPNPFTNTTSIRYTLPVNFKSAQIVITDVNGKKIKQVQLNASGKGMININESNLSNGTYTYSLIVDGKLMESRKMTVEK